MAYKILWYSISSLHDTTNGAAIANKVLLESLARRGFEIKVLNAMVADSAQGLDVFSKIVEQIKPNPDNKYLQFHDKNIEYFVAKTANHTTPTINTEEQSLLFIMFCQLLEKFQPDLVMGYSADYFSCYVWHEAACRGIPVAYALCNDLHHNFTFPDCDLVFTPSEATARAYKEQDGVEIKAVGQFIDRAKVTAKSRDEAKYITLVNSQPKKGLAVLVKLALVWQERHPEQKFLVVNNVSDYWQMVRTLHYADGTPFIDEEALQRDPNLGKTILPNIDRTEHTTEMHLVYGLSKVVLMPSICQEAWGCVATEANFNGIPVLASNTGGLPEAVSEGGVVLPPPASTLQDQYCIPSDEEIKPWVDALERLLNEDWTERCAQAAAHNDLEHSVDRLLFYLQPLLEKGQANKRPLEKSACFTYNFLQKNKADIEAEKAQDVASARAAKTAAPHQTPLASAVAAPGSAVNMQRYNKSHGQHGHKNKKKKR